MPKAKKKPLPKAAMQLIPMDPDTEAVFHSIRRETGLTGPISSSIRATLVELANRLPADGFSGKAENAVRANDREVAKLVAKLPLTNEVQGIRSRNKSAFFA